MAIVLRVLGALDGMMGPLLNVHGVATKSHEDDDDVSSMFLTFDVDNAELCGRGQAAFHFAADTAGGVDVDELSLQVGNRGEAVVMTLLAPVCAARAGGALHAA